MSRFDLLVLLTALMVGATADLSVFGFNRPFTKTFQAQAQAQHRPFATAAFPQRQFVRPQFGVQPGQFGAHFGAQFGSQQAVGQPVQSGPFGQPARFAAQPAGTQPVQTGVSQTAQPVVPQQVAGRESPSPLNEAGRRFLAQPDPQLCASRTIHDHFGPHGYYFSWLDPKTGPVAYDWLDFRSWCRKRCMDAVSLETAEENEFVKSKLRSAYQSGAIEFTWTSGRLCDFKGCDADYLQPIRTNGWFWSGSGARIAAKGQGFTDWAEIGGFAGQTQPDNREGEESCIAFLNPDIYKDPTKDFHWHDVACHHQKPVACEDSDELLGYVRQENPQLVIP